MRRIADLTLTSKDKAVIMAFIDQKPAESKKLLTNGLRLDGLWMGGSGIAHWEGGRIVMNDLGSRSAQTVQNYLKKETPKNLMRTAGSIIRDLERRIASLEVVSSKQDSMKLRLKIAGILMQAEMDVRRDSIKLERHLGPKTEKRLFDLLVELNSVALILEDDDKFIK